jgi:signal transduction histidine kinase
MSGSLGSLAVKTTALQDLIDRVRRQSAEGSAREAENNAIIRTLPDMMFRFSQDGVYLEYHVRNPTDLYVSSEQFLGKKVEDVMPPDLAATFKASFVTAARSREVVHVDYSLPMAGGERHYAARLVCLEGGEILSVVRDVTESRRALEELHRNQVALEASHRQVQELAGRLIVAQEAERRHIARELHDDISQRLALLATELDRLGHSATSKETAKQLEHLSRLTAEIASGVHRLSYRLHPALLEAIGLTAAIEGFCRELSSQSAIEIEFLHRDVPMTLAPDVGRGLFRIVQEALHNVVKHSGANYAAVHLSGFGDRLELRITDEGVGFAVDQSQTAGLGLVSMRERVTLLNGELLIHSAPGAGTRIEVRIPIPSWHAESA